MRVAQVLQKKPSLAQDAITTSVNTDATNVSYTSSTAEIENALLSSPYSGIETTSSILKNLDYVTTTPDILATDLTLTTATEITEAEEDILKYTLPKSMKSIEDIDRLTSLSLKSARRVTLYGSICQALECNRSLKVDKVRPEISNTAIEGAWSEFDTLLTARASTGVTKSSTLGPESRDPSSTATRIENTAISRRSDFSVGIGGRLPTGTDYSLEFSANRGSTNRTEPFWDNTLNLNITQNLLKGSGCDVNLIRVWTAQNNFVISLYQLQQVLINLVTDVQSAYWDYYLAMKALEIQRKAYQVAREQRERAEEFVKVGRAAPLESLSAQAEEVRRISDVISAAANLKRQELRFMRLISFTRYQQGYGLSIIPAETPSLPTEKLDARERVRLARYYRPDLRQAEIDLANGELEVVRTENGLLPQLDFFTNFGLAGTGDSFGHANEKMRTGEYPSYNLGLQFSYPLQNRAALSSHRRAQFQRIQAEEAIANFCELIEIDIRTAILEVERTLRLIDSTKATEILSERQLEAELEKFRVGRSTQVDVSQVQRDLVQAQLDRVSAEVAHIKAYLELYRVEGTALSRRGIEPIKIAPGSGVP